MNPNQANLKKALDEFLSISNKVIQNAIKGQSNPSTEELDLFAQKVLDLRHFSVEMMRNCKDESLWHNAEILKNLTESEIQLDGSPNKTTTLVYAADQKKKELKDENIRKIVLSLAKEASLREVFFEDLLEISRDLAA